jgi:hypothetical protein
MSLSRNALADSAYGETSKTASLDIPESTAKQHDELASKTRDRSGLYLTPWEAYQASKISILPSEVLHAIFQIYRHSTRGSFGDIILLSSICRHWRILAISNPPLWTSIRSTRLEIIQTQIERSADLPLEVIVWWFSSQNIQYLMDHCLTRIDTLAMGMGSGSLIQEVLRFISKLMPRLHSLELFFPGWWREAHEGVVIRLDAPRLQLLRIRDTCLNPSMIIPADLTELHLCGWEVKCVDVPELVHLLSHLHLRILKLEAAIFEHDSENSVLNQLLPVELPDLVQLYIDDLMVNIEGLINCLSLPSSASIALFIRSDDDDYTLRDRLAQLLFQAHWFQKHMLRSSVNTLELSNRSFEFYDISNINVNNRALRIGSGDFELSLEGCESWLNALDKFLIPYSRIHHLYIHNIYLGSNEPVSFISLVPLLQRYTHVHVLQMHEHPENGHPILQALSGAPLDVLASYLHSLVLSGHESDYSPDVLRALRYRSNLKSIRFTGASVPSGLRRDLDGRITEEPVSEWLIEQIIGE